MCYTAGEVNNMRTPEQVQEILRCLAQAYPADCSLQYQKDYELLFAVRLAAQCTDERVNQVTPALYARFPTLEAFAAAANGKATKIIIPSEIQGIAGLAEGVVQSVKDVPADKAE